MFGYRMIGWMTIPLHARRFDHCTYDTIFSWKLIAYMEICSWKPVIAYTDTYYLLPPFSLHNGSYRGAYN